MGPEAFDFWLGCLQDQMWQFHLPNLSDLAESRIAFDEETETKDLSKLLCLQRAELDKHFGHQSSSCLPGRGVCCLQRSITYACMETVLYILILSYRFSSRKSVFGFITSRE